MLESFWKVWTDAGNPASQEVEGVSRDVPGIRSTSHFPGTTAPVYGDLIPVQFLPGISGSNEAVHPQLVALLFAEDRHGAAPQDEEDAGGRRLGAAGQVRLYFPKHLRPTNAPSSLIGQKKPAQVDNGH